MLHDPRYDAKIKARGVLNAAADYIEAHGWCQCALRSGKKVCLFGALNAVGYAGMPSYDVIKSLRDATGSVNLAAWNDAHGRTKEQVIEALRKAAA